MPAPCFDALGNLHQLVFGCEVHQAFDEIETHTAHTGVMHVLQRLVRHVPLDRANPSG